MSQKRTSLQRTYFASPLALRYIEVPLYLILLTFLFFKKWWGWGGAAPPAPPHARALHGVEVLVFPTGGSTIKIRDIVAWARPLPRVFTLGDITKKKQNRSRSVDMTVPLSIEWSLSTVGKMSKYIPRDSFQRSHLWQLTTNLPRWYTVSSSLSRENRKETR